MKVNCQLRALAVLLPAKCLLYPLVLGSIWVLGGKEKSVTSVGNRRRILDFPATNLVTIPTYFETVRSSDTLLLCTYSRSFLHFSKLSQHKHFDDFFERSYMPIYEDSICLHRHLHLRTFT